ncbi:uncharacterized protein LOC132188256 [Corylus avellana]|uniref:uncharacterized protein LOC132188256 n=1 Tax=Corylus avellana TaxID=13451 RepID=UPI001E1EC60D|nr:uncharacterized protein LOC132188256 [Corylus avellana]
MEYLQDPYEAEEALSLCDLPIYSDDTASNWDDYTKEEQRLSSDNDFFEFFSEDFAAAATAASTANNHIIFCGKLIPYRETQSREISSGDTKQNQKKRDGFLRRKSLSFNKKKSKAEEKGSSALALPSSKGYVYAAKNSDFSVGKVSLLPPSTKSRWYLFLFGMAGLPTEMELTDIRTRQSRMKSQPSTMSQSSFECDEMVKGVGDNARRSRGKGLWRLLRMLGCSSTHQTNAVVKASAAGCVPHV